MAPLWRVTTTATEVTKQNTDQQNAKQLPYTENTRHEEAMHCTNVIPYTYIQMHASWPALHFLEGVHHATGGHNHKKTRKGTFLAKKNSCRWRPRKFCTCLTAHQHKTGYLVPYRSKGLGTVTASGLTRGPLRLTWALAYTTALHYCNTEFSKCRQLDRLQKFTEATTSAAAAAPQRQRHGSD